MFNIKGALCAIIIIISGLLANPVSAAPTHVELVKIRLLQPEAQMGPRLQNDASSLSAYIKLLENAAVMFFREHPEPNASGVSITVAVMPGKDVRVWCDAVKNLISREALSQLESKLAKVPSIEVQDGPVAFSLYFSLNERKPKAFPLFPVAWKKITQGKGISEPLVLDDLLEAVWTK